MQQEQNSKQQNATGHLKRDLSMWVTHSRSGQQWCKICGHMKEQILKADGVEVSAKGHNPEELERCEALWKEYYKILDKRLEQVLQSGYNTNEISHSH